MDVTVWGNPDITWGGQILHDGSTPISQLVDDVLAEVYGYTSTIDTTTYLTAGCTATDLTFTVGDATGFSRGIVQIGDELMIVTSVDRTANTLTVSSTQARGVRGTTADTHAIGDIVTMSPSIPRIQAVKAINQTIGSSSGLFAVDSVTFPFVSTQAGYTLSATADTVLSVAWYPPGPEARWVPIRRWTHDKFNNQIVLGEGVVPGADIRVVFCLNPIIPASTDDFSDTGLPESCIDVIRFGAAWRIVSFLEPASLLGQSAEADAMDRQLTPGSRIRVGQYLYQLYQQRLREEVANLQLRYPIRVHFGG